MVFHYFDGFGPKYIALVLAGGGTLASAATYLWRGGGKPYIDEMGLQDSESVLAPTTKSMKNKVNQVPQTQIPGSNNNNNTAVAAAAVVENAAGEVIPESTRNYSYKDVSSSAKAATEKAEQKLEDLSRQFGTTVQQIVDWISENKITVISFVVLLYAVQHLVRSNKAHQHYENELIRSGRVAVNPLESQSSLNAQSKPMSPSDSLTPQNQRVDSSTVPSAESENDLLTKQNQQNSATNSNSNNNNNNFPTSTWQSKARPDHADPEFEQIVKNLTPTQLEEYALALLPGIDLILDKDLIQRVRQEIFKIAPTPGWKAVLIDAKNVPNRNGTDDNDDKDDDYSVNKDVKELMDTTTRVSIPSFPISGQILRFVDSKGNLKLMHEDCTFELGQLERDARQRRVERLRTDSTMSGDSQ